MSKPSFRFRLFEIWHDRCAMKVGTDGVLLGAWAQVDRAKRILDIGTGSGLIAIMVAQRNREAKILGIDVDREAVEQARENGEHCPWDDRISFLVRDVRDFRTSLDSRYDCVLCNPPYYPEDTLPPVQARAYARHTAALSFEELLDASVLLMAPNGTLQVIVPANVMIHFITCALRRGLHLERRCLVRTTISKEPSRVLMLFRNSKVEEVKEEELALTNQDGTRSEEYSKLTQDYYLW